MDGGLVAIRHHSSKWGDYRTGTEKHHDPLPEGAEWLRDLDAPEVARWDRRVDPLYRVVQESIAGCETRHYYSILRWAS